MGKKNQELKWCNSLPGSAPSCQRGAPPSSHILPRVHLEEGKKKKKKRQQLNMTRNRWQEHYRWGRVWESWGQPGRKEGFP